MVVPSIKPIAWFHAYVLCTVIGIRRGKFTPIAAYACTNKDLNNILCEYLVYACGDDEWTKGRILEAFRHKTGTSMKADARKAFPSLFPHNRKARPLGVPDELKDQEVHFDRELIENWRQRVKVIKQEIAMDENALASDEAETAIELSDVKNKGGNSRVTVNFSIPEGVDPATLTLENYKELTTFRYRMTKDQKDVRKLSRPEAFDESKALAISQLGDK